MARKIICQCEDCDNFGIAQPETAFYASNFKLMNKKYPVCKKCVDKHTDISKLSGILGILQQLDFPYVNKVWKDTEKLYPDSVLGRYIAEIRRNQTTRKMCFADTEKMPKGDHKSIEIDIVTEAMRDQFGTNFTDEELLAMEKKYRFLQPSFDEVTSMHTEFLVSYIRYRVKEEFATADNDVISAKNWGMLAEKSAISAGLTPNQMKKADLIGGITTFGELTQIIEENANGVIPLLPQFKFDPQDSVDFNLYCYLDYCRHLEGKEPCSYQDIYKFYDKRKADYIEKTGDRHNIFKHDPTEENREMVEKFIKMPDENVPASGE